MNYDSDLHEDKLINFIKQLIINIIWSVCIVVIAGFGIAYLTGYEISYIKTGSMRPVLGVYDLIVTEQKDSSYEYEVGEILRYNKGVLPVAHRLIAVKQAKDGTVYIVHGDATQNLDGSEGDGSSLDDIAYIKDLDFSDKTRDEISCGNCDILFKSDIVGVVKEDYAIPLLGFVISLIKQHVFLLIGIVIAIWCVSETFAYEKEIRQANRLWL